jgi:NAD-dependent SIR2 family protein deacetylase
LKIKSLKNSNENNKLAIFVGAGVSKSSNLPDWNELITDIKKELKIAKNENDYLKISQLFYLSCGEVVYYQRLKEYFPDTIEPTDVQKLYKIGIK